MCINNCVAFTGPFKGVEICPECGENRYEPCPGSESQDLLGRRAQREFLTIPVGPQIQALYCTVEGAEAMRYRRDVTHKIVSELRPAEDGGEWKAPEALDDYLHGNEYLDAYARGDIQDTDTVLMLSIDGAQLDAHKQSNCWIYLW